MKKLLIGIFLVIFFLDQPSQAAESVVVKFKVTKLIQAEIRVADRSVMLSINQQPLQIIAPLNESLWKEYQKGYIRYGDFDGDKVQDLALLSSISYGGTNPCYEIYYYDTNKHHYLPSGEPLVCNIP